LFLDNDFGDLVAQKNKTPVPKTAEPVGREDLFLRSRAGGFCSKNRTPGQDSICISCAAHGWSWSRWALERIIASPWRWVPMTVGSAKLIWRAVSGLSTRWLRNKL